MIKDLIILALVFQVLIDVLSAAAIGKRLNAIEDRFFRKHEADVRHRDREVGARSEQIKVLKQRVHNETRKFKSSLNELHTRILTDEGSLKIAFRAINELQAKVRKSVKP